MGVDYKKIFLTVGINPHAMFVNQLPTQQTRQQSHARGHKGQINSPIHNHLRTIIDTQPPIQYRNRKHHDSHDAMAGCSNQSPNIGDNQLIQPANQCGERANHRSSAQKPYPSTGPKRIQGVKISGISAHQAEEGCGRKMYEHRVNRMSKYRHPTDNGSICHTAPLKMKLARYPFSLTALMGLSIPFLLSGCDGPQSALSPAGPAALTIVKLWWWMCTIAIVLVIAISGLWFTAMRQKKSQTETTQATQEKWIIAGGVILPTVSMFILLGFGLTAGYRLLPLTTQQVPVRIDIIGHQWWFEVRYADSGVKDINQLHLPLNHPIDIHASSQDVIHSFWVPSLGGKIDMVPGYENILRLQASKIGIFRGQCAEFCGLNHAHMTLKVIVEDANSFSSWLQTRQRMQQTPPVTI